MIVTHEQLERMICHVNNNTPHTLILYVDDTGYQIKQYTNSSDEISTITSYITIIEAFWFLSGALSTSFKN